MIKTTGIAKVTGVSKINLTSQQLYDLSFTGATIEETSPLVWGAVTGFGFNGKANASIPAGQDGYIKARFTGGDNYQARIMLSETDADPTPNEFGQVSEDFKWLVYPAGEFELYRVRDNGTFSNPGSIVPTADDWYILRRIGSTIYAYYERSGIETLFHTFSVTSAAALYFATEAADIGYANFLTTPKAYY